MQAKGYHGTTKSAATSILDGQPFHVSSNKGDWLGSGVYFWQDAPGRAWDWARRISTAKAEEPAVLVATIDLSRCLDLLDIWGFRALQQEYADFERIVGSPEQDALEIVGGRTRHPPGGVALVDRNQRDKAAIDFAVASISAKTGESISTVRSPILWGRGLFPTSFLFDWSNVHISVTDQSAILGCELSPPA